MIPTQTNKKTVLNFGDKPLYLKGQCHETFCFWFFHESVSPSPKVFYLDCFKVFRKFAEIFAFQGAPPVSTTPVANFSTIFASVVDTGGK
jgi:hypothetical protein